MDLIRGLNGYTISILEIQIHLNVRLIFPTCKIHIPKDLKDDLINIK